MIKTIIFDLDGVLLNAKEIHFHSLNKSLGEYKISWDDHLSIYDGLKTYQKLEILHIRKNLPREKFKDIWLEKQKYTLELIKNIQEDNDLICLMKKLIEDNFKLVVCSNSIRKTVMLSLSKLGIIEFFDLILSNDDVKNPKPHPEIYWKAISTIGCLPEETLIVEDSPNGLLSAYKSNSNVLRVDNPKDVTYENIKNRIYKIKNDELISKPKWVDEKLNVIIPMAGAGSRFIEFGFVDPKPLINIFKKPMIQVVVENLQIDANYIYIVQKKHRESYRLDSILNLLTPNCKIVEVDGLTEGATCTALLAKNYINNNNPLFISNSDQYVDWNSMEFFYKMNETNSDGGIVTFNSTHPKWSFVKINENGFVIEVAEKNPISDIATVGFYYWKKGSDFVKYSEEMIKENIRVNGEFYICPVFNQAIKDGKKISIFMSKKMWGLGTPEDLDKFVKQKEDDSNK